MKRSFLKGNDAIICGALYAGCRAFFGYPITPASEIAFDAMKLFPQAGALALQAESEVAAINMLYGAAATGTAAMTATSGPGFSLMQEGISYMAAANLPGVIVDIMRTGPGLGNIGPEQGDYFMATHGGGHGHYHTPVLAPASVGEMFSLTIKAFEIAFQYQVPVILIADAFIGQMMETLDIPDNLPTPNQIPQSASPFVHAVTGTQETYGNIISSLELIPAKQKLKNDARFQKYASMEQALPELIPSRTETSPSAETLVIAYGICARLAHEAVNIANQQGKAVGFLSPRSLWPLPEKELISTAKSAKRVIVVECSRGQFTQDIERILGRERVTGIYSDGGILPEIHDILENL